MMKALYARQVYGRGFVVRVHLDDTRRLGDGQPDPAYVREYVFPSEHPEGHTKSRYLANIRREVRILSEHELAQLQGQAESAMGFEGHEV